MSKISIEGNASGTGTLTIAAPNTNSNRTLNLPDASGTMVVTGGAQTIEFAAGTASAPSITTTGDTNTGIFFPAADTIAFTEGGAEAMRIDSSGNVGIGNTSPNARLDVTSTSAGANTNTLFLNNLSSNASTSTSLVFGVSTAPTIRNATIQAINAGGNAINLAFLTSDGDAPAERMRITSAGRVGIGTTSPQFQLQVINGGLDSRGSGNGIAIRNNVYFSSGDKYLTASGAASTQYFDGSGNIIWYNTSTASTGAGNSATLTERARIASTGAITTPDTASAAHQFGVSRVDGVIIGFRNAAASSPYGVSIQFTAASPDNNTNYFLQCSDSTANRTIIYSDGDVWTADAGTLSSDQKLKNTITDASPKLDDVMKLRVRNFYWNEDYHPEKTDKKLIGFIAQEFEEVFPGLVTEGVIRGGQPIYEDQAIVDEEGNPVLNEEGNAKTEQVQVGETEKEYAKGIKEGKLIPILVKALQEAVERIETLEANNAALEARITAIENGA